MAVIYMLPIGERQGMFGLITTWSAERRWLALCDTRFAEEWQILEFGWAEGVLPVPYRNVLGSQPLLLCRSVGAKQQKDSPQHWIVTATYSSEPLTQQQREAQQFENPLDRPAKVRWNTAKYNKPVFIDNDGNNLVNSAGEFFDPPAEVDRSRWTATVTKNVEGIPFYIIEFTDAINDADFTIQGVPVAHRCAKIMSIEISEEQTAQINETDTIEYFVFSYTMEFRPETWVLYLQDQGYRQISTTDDTKRIPIKDDGTPPKDVTKPWPLDGMGGKLADPSPTNTKLISFNVYTEQSFLVLPGIDEEQ